MRHAASAHARCDARRLACSSAASLQAHTVCVGQPPAARALARARALLRGRGEGRSASRSHRAVPGAVPRLSTPSCAGGAPLEPTGHGAERPGALHRAELAPPGPGPREWCGGTWRGTLRRRARVDLCHTPRSVRIARSRTVQTVPSFLLFRRLLLSVGPPTAIPSLYYKCATGFQLTILAFRVFCFFLQ